MGGCALEPEVRIVFRGSEHDHEGTTVFAQQAEAVEDVADDDDLVIGGQG